jgi:hypothetical protein
MMTARRSCQARSVNPAPPRRAGTGTARDPVRHGPAQHVLGAALRAGRVPRHPGSWLRGSGGDQAGLVSKDDGLHPVAPAELAEDPATWVLTVASLSVSAAASSALDMGPGPGPALPSLAAQQPAVPAALRAQPGTLRYVTEADDDLAVLGLPDPVSLIGFGGDAGWTGYALIASHWYSGAGQADVNTAFLTDAGTTVGDSYTLTSAAGSSPPRSPGRSSTRAGAMRRSSPASPPWPPWIRA